MEKISRKSFLKIAAAAAMGSVTAAGLTACNAASSASGTSSAAGIYTPWMVMMCSFLQNASFT